jgi:hypothetical protein
LWWTVVTRAKQKSIKMCDDDVAALVVDNGAFQSLKKIAFCKKKILKKKIIHKFERKKSETSQNSEKWKFSEHNFLDYTPNNRENGLKLKEKWIKISKKCDSTTNKCFQVSSFHKKN